MGNMGVTNNNLYKNDQNNDNYGKTSWNDIVGKPNEFKPSSHNHDTQYLNKENTQEYTPEGDYNPVPKKYVDDEIRTAMSANVSKEIAFNKTQYVQNAEYLISGDTTLSAINSEPIEDTTNGLIINNKAQKITLQASNSGVKKVFDTALDLTKINEADSADTDYLMFLFYIDSANYAIFTGNLVVTFYSDSNANKGFSFSIAKANITEGNNIFKIKKNQLTELGLNPELSSLDRVYISIDTDQVSAVDFIINAILLIRKDSAEDIANIFFDSDLNKDFIIEAGEFVPGLDNNIYNILAVNGKIVSVEDLSKGAINYNVVAKANNVCDGLVFKRGNNEFITMYINNNQLVLRIVNSEGTILEKTLNLGFTILEKDEIIYRFNFNNDQINIYIHRNSDVREDTEAIIIPEEVETYYFGCITNNNGKLDVNYISNELNGIVKKDNSLQYGLNAERLEGKSTEDIVCEANLVKNLNYAGKDDISIPIKTATLFGNVEEYADRMQTLSGICTGNVDNLQLPFEINTNLANGFKNYSSSFPGGVAINANGNTTAENINTVLHRTNRDSNSYIWFYFMSGKLNLIFDMVIPRKGKLRTYIDYTGTVKGLYGSNDKTNWESISGFYTGSCEVNCDVAYRYFKLEFDTTYDNSYKEVRLFYLYFYNIDDFAIKKKNNFTFDGTILDNQILKVKTPNGFDLIDVAKSSINGILVDNILLPNEFYNLIYNSNIFITKANLILDMEITETSSLINIADILNTDGVYYIGIYYVIDSMGNYGVIQFKDNNNATAFSMKQYYATHFTTLLLFIQKGKISIFYTDYNDNYTIKGSESFTDVNIIPSYPFKAGTHIQIRRLD